MFANRYRIYVFNIMRFMNNVNVYVYIIIYFKYKYMILNVSRRGYLLCFIVSVRNIEHANTDEYTFFVLNIFLVIRYVIIY